ncbi:MAG TPA: hypothetical protein VGZ71_09750, partial [Puia sp.]|nr:hypothetical protein [Puia sp.]
MQTFLEYLQEKELRGEWWIVDGSTQFADANVGDYNHEGLAIEHVFHMFASNIIELAKEMEIDASKAERYGEYDTEELSNILHQIHEKL